MMTTSFCCDFITPSQTIRVDETVITAASLVEEISPIGDTLPINKLTVSVLADNTFYSQLITATQVDAYFTADGATSLLGVFYLSTQTAPKTGVAKFEMVDIIGRLDTEVFFGDYYCSNPSGTAAHVGVDYTTYLNDVLGSGGYTLDSSLSGRVLGFVSGCTKREALQQFTIATGTVIDTTRGRTIRIKPMATAVTKSITASEKVTGHTMSMEEQVDAVRVVNHRWKYAYSSSKLATESFSLIQAWQSTATLLYGHPSVLKTINGYAPEKYCSQMGYTIVKSGLAGITMTAPEDPYSEEGSLSELTLAMEKYYVESTWDYYTNYAAANPDSTLSLKTVSDAMLIGFDNREAVANRLLSYYQKRCIAEGKLLPNTVTAGQLVTMPTMWGSLTGYVERVTTDLTGGGIQKVKVRGEIATSNNHPSREFSV